MVVIAGHGRGAVGGRGGCIGGGIGVVLQVGVLSCRPDGWGKGQGMERWQHHMVLQQDASSCALNQALKPCEVSRARDVCCVLNQASKESGIQKSAEQKNDFIPASFSWAFLRCGPEWGPFWGPNPKILGFCSNINQVFVGTILSFSLELQTM